MEHPGIYMTGMYLHPGKIVLGMKFVATLISFWTLPSPYTFHHARPL
jgi:hypothetical protein